MISVLIFNWLLFLVMLISILVECNRVPFDLTEAESEIVAGFLTEFSSIYFSILMLSEYLSIIVFSLFLLLLFGFYFSLFLFIISLICLSRGTLHRFKFDELLNFGWYYCLILIFSFFILILSF